MDFSLSKEQKLIQKAAYDYSHHHVKPMLDTIVNTNHIPDEMLIELGELGMFGIPFPERFGGGGGGYLDYVLALEQLSRVCPGIGMIISVNTVGLSVIHALGTEDQKDFYLPRGMKGKEIFSFAFTEPGTGSDPKQLTTTARWDGDKFILNGTKRFISNAGYPGPMVIIAREEDTNQASAFIIEKFCTGYSLSEKWNKIGAKGGPLYDVYLNNVEVEQSQLLGQRGQGLWALKLAMAYGKIGLTGLFLGIAASAYEEGRQYALQKTHRGTPIADKFEHIKIALADMAMKYDSCRWYAYHLGWAADTFKDAWQLVKEAALTKVLVAETAVDICRISMGIHASYGLMRDYKIAQLWDDAIMGPQVEGTAPVLKILAAGILLKESLPD